MEMRVVCVRDGGVTSAAAVARMMLHVWVCRIVLTHAFDKQSLRLSIDVVAAQLLKCLVQQLDARATGAAALAQIALLTQQVKSSPAPAPLLRRTNCCT